MEWEVGIIEWLQGGPAALNRILGGCFSFIGGETGLMILLVIALFCWKKEAGQKLALTVASLHVWFAMIKAGVMRLRPVRKYPDRVSPTALPAPEAPAADIAAQGYSFPSMHSGAVAAAYFTLAREIRRRWAWILAAALTLLVGVFRAATGCHYPTDVLAGWALGFAVIAVFEWLERRVEKEWARLLILLAVSLPGLIYVRTEDYFTSLGLLVGAAAAIPFERRYVGYRDTRNVLAMLLRAAGAFVVYFGLNTLLKLPFPEAFLDGGSFAALAVRAVRYAVDLFVIMGVYPMLFPLFERIGRRA